MVSNPFRLNKMCEDCPFRSDKSFPLGKGRRAQIADSIRDGAVFHCHKTVSYDDDGEGAIVDKSQVCAGSLRTIQEGDEPTPDIIQIAERLGLYDPERIERSHPPVHKGLTEWVENDPWE